MNPTGVGINFPSFVTAQLLIDVEESGRLCLRFHRSHHRWKHSKTRLRRCSSVDRRTALGADVRYRPGGALVQLAPNAVRSSALTRTTSKGECETLRAATETVRQPRFALGGHAAQDADKAMAFLNDMTSVYRSAARTKSHRGGIA